MFFSELLEIFFMSFAHCRLQLAFHVAHAAISNSMKSADMTDSHVCTIEPVKIR